MNRGCGWAAPQRQRPVRRRQVPQLLALLSAAAALGLAGCGSSAHALPTLRPTSTPTPTANVIATATPEATDVTIIAAYKAEITAYDQALADTVNPGAWTLPALADTMVNPELDAVKAELQSFENQGIVVTGTQTSLDPKVVSESGTTAVVSDCVWDTTVQYYGAHNGFTAEPVPDQPGGTQSGGDATSATLTLVSGKWMVANVTQEVDSCSGS